MPDTIEVTITEPGIVIRPGDTVIFRVPNHEGFDAMAEAIQAALAERGIRGIVLSDDITVEAVKHAEVPS